MQHLTADYTEVWVPAAQVPLIRFADRVRAISSTGLDRLELPGVHSPALGHLAAFDEIVSWYGSNREQFRTSVRHLPFIFHPPLPEGPLHAVDFYAAQTGAPPGAVPSIQCPRTAGGYIAIHPFSGSVSKNWPLARFQELARRQGRQVRFCAGPEEELTGAERFEDLFTLASWLASAQAYVGNDSGITHLAAAVGTPVVAIFGPTDPAIWAPRGPSIAVLREDDVTVEEVDRALQRLC